jgi:hypothetical protein
MAEWFSRTNVYYWRIGETILIRPLPLFDGEGSLDREHVILNSRSSIYLAEDYTVDGVNYPKPPAVVEVEWTMTPGSERYAIEVCKAAIKPSPLDPPLP